MNRKLYQTGLLCSSSTTFPTLSAALGEFPFHCLSSFQITESFGKISLGGSYGFIKSQLPRLSPDGL